MREQHIRRPYVYELDLLRVCTILGVIGVHVLSFTAYLNHSVAGEQIQNAFVVALHYTREIFMFLTAFAMVYVYYGKPFQVKRFWLKRGIGVLLPYCIWSALYTWINTSAHAPLPFLQTTFLNIVTGNASYQLYYVLLTLQFYIVLPLFLFFLQRVRQHPWIVLSVSFIVQFVLTYADYHLLQAGTTASSGFWQVASQYQNRFVLIYQLYFFMGAFTALYWNQVRSFLLHHGRLVMCSFLVALMVLWIHFVLQIRVYQESLDYATSVLQPMMVVYNLAVIPFFLWIFCRLTTRTNATGLPQGHKFWHTLSDASFGVYLIHPLVLTSLINWFIPLLSTLWPVALRVFLVWFLTASITMSISLLLLHTPFLSRLVGRTTPARRNIVAPLMQKESSQDTTGQEMSTSLPIAAHHER